GRDRERHQHSSILGVHVQLLTVQLGQLGVGCFEIFQVLHGFPKGAEHFLAMGADLGVTDDGSGAGQVPEAIKEPLGPGVDDQQPGLSSAFLHVDLAPDAGDELLLLGCTSPLPRLQDCSGMLELAGTGWGRFLCSSDGHTALMGQALPCPLPSGKLKALHKNSRTSHVAARPATSPSTTSEPDKRLLLGSGSQSPLELDFCFS
uniref:Uncharacterized protein n=1 Tax=Anser cygnoides TaxID=8845 RepID=A0A8B9IJH1_ANSCY